MMRAIGLIAVKECREMWRDARVLLAVGFGFILIGAVSLGGVRHYQIVAHEKAEAAEVERARWLNLGDYGPHSAAHHGLYVFKPQSMLTAFEPGTEQYLGVSVWLEAHKQNQFNYRPMQDAAPVQRFSVLTPASAFQLLGPLIIILLGFNAFAGERDQGTLRQLASTGVVGRELLFGKAVAVAGALFLVLLPALSVAIVVLATSSADLPWPRLILLGAVYMLYLGVFLGLTLAVSALMRSARAALVLLLAIWVVNGFLLPRAVVEVAERIAPLPSAREWRAQMEAEERDGHEVTAEHVVKRELLQQYGVESEDALPVNWRGVLLQRGEEQNYPVFDKHFNRLFDDIRRQDEIYQWGGLFAPALSVQSLSMGLAGSDFEHHRAFVRAAEDHRRLIQKTVNNELALHPEAEWGAYRAGPELWARVPEFRYDMPDLQDVSWRYAPAALVLAGWFVVAWGLALRAATRLRP